MLNQTLQLSNSSLDSQSKNNSFTIKAGGPIFGDGQCLWNTNITQTRTNMKCLSTRSTRVYTLSKSNISRKKL